MTYDNFISQFEILNNPSPKKGFHRHHIVPRSEQIEKDGRCVYLLPSQHAYAHWLYDLENGTSTAEFLIKRSGLRKDEIHSYEDLLILDVKPWLLDKNRKIVSERMKGNNHHLGKRNTEEAKKRMSEAHMGISNPHTEEWNEHIKESQPKKGVQQFSLDGQLVAEYPSINEAGRQTGVNISKICLCCQGKRNKAGNYKWKYKTAI